MASDSFDLAVVGAGIVGLAHALAAARLGKRVVVIDRDARANGASVRNFGFVTVTGQQRGDCWRRARRSRDVWAEVAPLAGIRVEQRGLLMAARRPEARAVLEAFLATEMGEGCELLAPARGQGALPDARGRRRSPAPCGARTNCGSNCATAIPALAAWLEEAHGVTFLRRTQVRAVEPPRLETTTRHRAGRDLRRLPGRRLPRPVPRAPAAYGLTRCKLHMLRVAARRRAGACPGR